MIPVEPLWASLGIRGGSFALVVVVAVLVDVRGDPK